MNENIDLVKILKDCPKGTKLYSTTYGEVEFVVINDHSSYPIIVRTKNNLVLGMTASGKCTYKYEDAECVLFPSKDQRDWSKFKAPIEKFDYNTLQPFDMVLVRDGEGEGEGEGDYWRCGLFSCMLSNGMLCECRWEQGIPYNDETKHLLGTGDMPDEKYIWWED